MTLEELNAKYGKPKTVVSNTPNVASDTMSPGDSLMAKWAQRDEAKKPLTTKLGELGTQYGEELLKESRQAEIGAQSPAVTAIKQAGATGRLVMEGLGKTLGAVTPEPVKEALKPVGEVAGQALGYAVEPAANLISESKGLQKLATTTQTPEIAQSLSDLVNGILAIEGTVTGLTGAAKGVAKIPTVTKEAVSATKTGLGKAKGAASEGMGGVEAKVRGLTPEKSVERFKNAFSEQMYGTQARTKKLEGYDTDVIDTIAKDTRYHPEIDVDNKSLITSNSVQSLTDDIAAGSKKLDELFKKVDETYGGVDTQKVVQEVTKNVIQEMNKPIFVELGMKPFIEIGEKLQRLKQVYPDAVPRTEVWELRKTLDDAIEKLSDSNLKRQLRLQQRKAYSKILEDIPGSEKNLVKRGMGEIQKMIEARDFMAQSVNGAKLKGGRLGDMLRNAVATGLGQSSAAALGGTFWGIPGAAVAYGASKKLGEWLAKNTLTTAGDRLVLEKLIVSRPDIWNEIVDYIKGLTPEEKAMVAKNLNSGKTLELAGAKPAWAVKAKVEDALPKETFKQYLKRKSEEAKAGLKKFSRRSSKGMVNFGAMAEDLMGKKEIKPKPGQTKEDFIKEQQAEFELKQKDEVKGKAPSKYDDNSASGNDLSKVFTEDIYGDKADDIYGVNPYDKATLTIIKDMKDNPTKQVMVYRAVPKGAKETEITAGDWVTINPKYAKEHAEKSLPEGFKMITKKVQANEIFNNGNSINEWGYTPKAKGEISDEALGKKFEDHTLETELGDEVKTSLRGAKGMTADDIMATYPNIQLKKDIVATDVYGKKITIPEGEKLTPYELKGNKILLQDGETYIVSKNQYQNIKGNAVEAVGKPFAPEMEGTKETVRGARDYGLEVMMGEEGAYESLPKKIQKILDKYAGEDNDYADNAKLISKLEAEGWTADYDLGGEIYSLSKISEGLPTKYSSYQLPGGKNYREVLIQAPGKTDFSDFKIEEMTYDNGETRYFATHPNGRSQAFKSRAEAEAQLEKDKKTYGDIQKDSNSFKSSHWEEPNVLAHTRLKEYDTDKYGQVTFMEEAQSDWSRELRKAEEAKAKGETYDQIDNHPLLKDWQEMTVKRALKDAVDNGSDYFAWINGAQTSERYNLATYVDNVNWGKSINNDGTKSVKLMPKNKGNLIFLNIDENGVVQKGTKYSNMPSEWEGKKIDEFLGKGLADKIMGKEEGTLSGEGLKFGGEWAENLYDKQIPNIVRDLTGAKIETLDMGLPIKNNRRSSYFIDYYNTYETRGGIKAEQIGKQYKTGDTLQRVTADGTGESDLWVITDILGDGKFKAVPKSRFEGLNNIKKKKEIDEIRKSGSIFEETFDISNPTTTQMGIKLTPEIKAKIRGEAPEIITSGKKLEDVVEAPKETPKETSSLEEEAKKYKTPEEFVKAQGTPVYHGTNADFTEFDPKKIGNRDSGWFGKGFYFTNTKGEASYYGKNIKEVYLNLKKPFDFSAFGNKNFKGSSIADGQILSEMSKVIPEIKTKLKIEIADELPTKENDYKRFIKKIPFGEYDKMVKKENLSKDSTFYKDEKTNTSYYSYKDIFGNEKDFKYFGNKKIPDDLLDYALFNEKYRVDTGTNYLYGIEKEIADNLGESFTNRLKELGYDGTMQSPEGDEYVAFYPEQIKTKQQLTDIWNKAHGVETPKAEGYKETGELTTKILRSLEGKTNVSKEYVENLLKQSDVKQSEKNIFKSILKNEGNKINVQDLANKVKAELLPITRGKEGKEYESTTLPEEIRGNVSKYSTYTYESPITTSVGNLNPLLGGHPLLGGSKNYFAHSRVEDMADNQIRRVIEIQSDLFQKGRLNKEGLNQNYSEDVIKLGEKYGITNIKDLPETKRVDFEKEMNALKKKYKEQSGIVKLEPYRNIWYERVIREEIKKAADDGKTKVQFPTGKTAMKIERLTQTARWHELGNNSELLTPDTLKVGKEISGNPNARDGQKWIITDVLGNGKFKAVPRNALTDDNIKELKKRKLDTSELYDVEQFDISGKVDTNNPIYKFYENDVQKYLKQFGGKRITDDKGVEWVEVPITDKIKKLPVEAFGVAGLGYYGYEKTNE